MSIKPIRFTTDEVRATLDGRKTTKRLVVKFLENRNPQWSGYIPDGAVLYGSNNIPAAKSPYRPGDVLWVRETWANHGSGYYYRADADERGGGAYYLEHRAGMTYESGVRWRPSIHMPREAARIWLRVTNVRVERLQEIKNHECVAEGAVKRPNYTKRQDLVLHNRYRQEFAKLWDSTSKPADRERYGWSANPWVWVIEFKRCEKPDGV